MFFNNILTFVFVFLFSEVSDLFTSVSVGCPSMCIVFSPMRAEVATVATSLFLRIEGRAKMAYGEACGWWLRDAFGHEMESWEAVQMRIVTSLVSVLLPFPRASGFHVLSMSFDRQWTYSFLKRDLWLKATQGRRDLFGLQFEVIVLYCREVQAGS